MNTEEPLIWTSKGNLPIRDLDYTSLWVDTPDYVKFTETYKLGGEVVKESHHVMTKTGLSLGLEQAQF